MNAMDGSGSEGLSDGEAYGTDESDSGGPTALNPWGRDGDKLGEGLEAFVQMVDARRSAEGRAYADIFAARDEDGFNALHHCAFQGHGEILGFILRSAEAGGLDGLLRSRVVTGEMALHLAVQYRREECAERLLQAQADAGSRDSYQQTCLDYVSRPTECRGPTYMIAGDPEYLARMRTRLQNAVGLQAARQRLRTVQGLASQQGQALNGRACELMGTDPATGRCMVRFEPGDPKEAWKKLRPENLLPLEGAPGPSPAAAGLASDRCRSCWTTAEERARLLSVMPFLTSAGPLAACPSCCQPPGWGEAPRAG